MKSYTFGPFRLDLRSGELRRGGEEIPLEPRVFALLTYLLEHRGRLITREELLETIWPDTHVSDASLSQAVASLREALDDEARHPTYIATMPRRGYKFIRDVVEEQTDRAAYHIILGSQDFILAPGENIIGRAGDAAVRVDSRKVSRHHARILIAPDAVSIEDLGSRNGTVVEDKLIEGRRDLHDGDAIRIGDAILLFHISRTGDEPPTAPT